MSDISCGLAVEDLDSIAKKIREKFPSLLPGEDTDYPAFHAPEAQLIERAIQVNLGASLSCFAMEQLLEEAAVLVSRCAQARELKLDLEAKALDFWLEVESLEAQELVRRRQIAAGEFSLSGHTSRLEAELHDTSEQSFSEALKLKRIAESIRGTGSRLGQERVQLSGSVASLSAYTNFAAVRKAAEELAENTLSCELISAQADTFSTNPSVVFHSKMKEVADSRVKYELVNEAAKGDLFEIEVSARKKRAAFAVQPGVGLNYRERMLENQALFERDFISAYSRAVAVREGFESILGISVPIPGPAASLSDFIVWIRERTEDLASLSGREIVTSISFSLRTLCGAQGWQEGVATGSFIFNVPASQFGDLKCVRIRGARSFLKTNAVGSWCLNYNLPTSAEIIQLDGKSKILSQDNSACLWFGSVTSRRPDHREASCGGRSVVGRSVIGQWTALVASQSDEGEPLSVIDDIKIELDIIAYR
ncbi:hypothetical protein QVM62_30585 [Pseudomonas putida]|uniref:Tc toxin complex TcA C-terminal TcB-binding domain-containing protein n=1 Tax=Pseudomonas putida (strain GB-1) TaxID=76869 RepID=B0KR99_PSEPG|nr:MULTISPECIES: hypothetical protein [Pseudomonas]ABZ01304.1 hypothetical protein PputGB1_5422 [Pseudomonas putida GB-1]MBP0710270.1 hypothetical protein [Pseudomonas sp. T34]MCK2189717.1 hypothetical protein [Pseudomonas sp. MB04B]MDD2084574.1 hypothetical protein [Pseudomonas putida]MDD2094547.1 hypothetical protein [Pseudomonas putida]